MWSVDGESFSDGDVSCYFIKSSYDREDDWIEEDEGDEKRGRIGSFEGGVGIKEEFCVDCVINSEELEVMRFEGMV